MAFRAEADAFLGLTTLAVFWLDDMRLGDTGASSRSRRSVRLAIRAASTSARRATKDVGGPMTIEADTTGTRERHQSLRRAWRASVEGIL